MITLTDLLVVLSNVALVVATGFACWLTLREDHRHTETEQVIHLVKDAEAAQNGPRHACKDDDEEGPQAA